MIEESIDFSEVLRDNTVGILYNVLRPGRISETCACNMYNTRAAEYNRAPDNPVIRYNAIVRGASIDMASGFT